MVFSLPFNSFSLHILVFSLLIILGNLDIFRELYPTMWRFGQYLQNPQNRPKMGKFPCFLPDKQGI